MRLGERRPKVRLYQAFQALSIGHWVGKTRNGTEMDHGQGC